MIPREYLPVPTEVRRIVLWRHGRTEWNLLGRAQGHADVSLDEVGIAQARRAAPFLASYRPALVWSSDLARARQTAEFLVALTGQELVLDKRLREYDVGARQGLTFEEFEAKLPAAYRAFRSGERGEAGEQVPGAESADEVNSRMVAVLTDAAAALEPGETAVLVGHGAALRSGLLTFFGLPSEFSAMLAGMANCAWAVLEQRANHGWQIIDYNAQTLPEPIELADEPRG
ncbi:MAG TPA: histidine phosphatase family protein [Nocardioidaceae bacterium]|nr:histidine phosphatase family protein [Nocardioidaceae bacterium]